MSASAKARVNDLKEALSKELPVDSGESVERVHDVLQALDRCEMTLEILSDTMIGKIVSQLKSHPTLNTTAKALVKKWKQVAKHTSETNSHSNTTPRRPALSSSSLSVSPSVNKPEKQTSERRDSRVNSPPAAADLEWQGLAPMRQNICKKFYELLLLAKPALTEAGVNTDAVDHLIGPRAVEIEASLTEKFRDRKGYTDKARSLAFNLKKNQSLCQEVILGQVSASELVSFTSEQLASAETRQARATEAKKLIDSRRLDWDQANEDKINEMCGIKGDLLNASLFTCGRCKSVKTTSTQKQTRSADEPMTVFVLCLNCGNRWKC
jgi:transcription elongation factor S-II